MNMMYWTVVALAFISTAMIVSGRKSHWKRSRKTKPASQNCPIDRTTASFLISIVTTQPQSQSTRQNNREKRETANVKVIWPFDCRYAALHLGKEPLYEVKVAECCEKCEESFKTLQLNDSPSLEYIKTHGLVKGFRCVVRCVYDHAVEYSSKRQGETGEDGSAGMPGPSARNSTQPGQKEKPKCPTAVRKSGPGAPCVERSCIRL